MVDGIFRTTFDNLDGEFLGADGESQRLTINS